MSTAQERTAAFVVSFKQDTAARARNPRRPDTSAMLCEAEARAAFIDHGGSEAGWQALSEAQRATHIAEARAIAQAA